MMESNDKLIDYKLLLITIKAAGARLQAYSVFVLAFISGYIYFCTYSFESAIFNFYHLPQAYINLSLNTIVSDSYYTLSYLFWVGIVLFLGIGIIQLNAVKRPRLSKWIGYNMLAIAYLILVYYAKIVKSEDWFWYILPCAVYEVLITIIVYFNLLRSKKTPKLPPSPTDESEMKVMMYFGFSIVMIVVLYLNANVVVPNIAVINAGRQSVFAVVDSTKDIVIRKNNDELLCVDTASFNSRNTRIERLSLSDKKLICTHYETVHLKEN